MEVMEVMETKVYKIEEVAIMMGISKSYVYQMIKENKIPVVRLGRRIIIPKVKFDKWIEQL